MSSDWVVIAPAALVAMGALVVLARRLRHPPGGHRTDRARLEAVPPVLRRTVPVARVSGLPPWQAHAGQPAWAEPGTGHGPGSLGTWFPHDDLEATLRRELHHVDGYDPDPFGTEQIEAWIRDGTQVNWADDSPREDGAGDESEGSGLTAPPAPLLRPVDLALARCDLFMVAMRADHERWMIGARERWAAA